MNNICKKPNVEDNLGLVHLCANKFRGKGIEYEDMYSAGCIGLLKAVKAFDTERGVQFSTYAVPVILGEIKRLFRDGGTIKVSRSLKELSMKLQRIREDYIRKNGKEPTVKELAEISGCDISDVSEALCVSMPVISLTSDSDDEGQIDLPTDSPDTELVDILALRQLMSKLDLSDKALLELRYFKGFTQSKTAELLNMSQVQVSRKEKKILAKLREQLLE